MRQSDCVAIKIIAEKLSLRERSEATDEAISDESCGIAASPAAPRNDEKLHYCTV